MFAQSFDYRFLAVFSPRDLGNRVRDEILRILVLGELQRMISKRFYETCAKHRISQLLLAPTIIPGDFGGWGDDF